jgi:hypothetical protein
MSKFRVQVTGFAKDHGSLTKHIELVNDKVANDSSNCFMASGSAWRFELDSATAIADFINNHAQNEAYALGRLKEGRPARVRVVTAAKLSEAKGDPSVIARTKDYLVFVKGVPGLALLDIDLKGISEAAKRQIDDAGGVWKALCKSFRRSRPPPASGALRPQAAFVTRRRGCSTQTLAVSISLSRSPMPRTFPASCPTSMTDCGSTASGGAWFRRRDRSSNAR